MSDGRGCLKQCVTHLYIFTTKKFYYILIVPKLHPIVQTFHLNYDFTSKMAM